MPRLDVPDGAARLLQDDADHFGRQASGGVRGVERRQILQLAGGALRSAVLVTEMKENVGRLSLQLSVDVRNLRGVRAARVEKGDGPVAAKFDCLPAKKFHEHVARFRGRRPGEEGRDDFLDREFVRTGQDEARRPLLQKQLLQRSQLVQNRLLNRGRKPAEKAFEPFDDVEKRGADSFQF